jgi:hypothetical protein
MNTGRKVVKVVKAINKTNPLLREGEGVGTIRRL